MLIIKDFKWSQTETEIFIQISLKGATNHADILTHENFIKIHAAPYYFEAFLLHPITEDGSRCQLTKDEARFILKKAEPIEWESLERSFIDKAEKAQVKNEIIEKVQETTKEKLKQKLEEKEKIKRFEIENSIAKDAEIRESIEIMQKQVVQQEMSRVQSVEMAPEKKVKIKVAEKKKPPVEVPAVRKSAAIEIQFSKRNFVTPKRESQDPAEQQWLLKQAEARKAVGFVAEDLRPEERDPMFLKNKGDEFYRQKNYLAAISAYTTGISMADKCFELYLNRSAAQFAYENFQRCAKDCSKALELLDPPVEANLKPRVQALTRRGAALTRLGFIRQAYGEFVAAVKLDPSDEILRHDAEMLRAKLEANDE